MVNFWLESLRDILFTAIGTFAGVIGAIYIFKQGEKSTYSKSHLLRIRDEVLNPWLGKINLEKDKEKRITFLPIKSDFLIEERYNSINKELFRDILNNHFPILNLIESNLNKSERNISDEIDKLSIELGAEFKGKEFDKEALRRFFILGQDTYPNLNIHIGYDNLMCGSRILCRSDEETSKKIRLKLEKLYKDKRGKKIKGLYIEFEKIRENLIKGLEKSLAAEKLSGECNLIT